MQLLFLVCIYFLLAFIIYQVTRRNLLPALGEYAGHIRFNGYKQLSRKERRAMIGAVSIGVDLYNRDSLGYFLFMGYFA